MPALAVGPVSLHRNPIVVAVATASVAAAALAAVPSAALAAVSPPSLSSAFTPTSITVGGTSALSFTITNPNSSGSLSNIAFTDTLPAGLVVDNPNGQNGTCGSTSTLTANPGTSTISLTGGKLAAGASCTVSAAVTSNVPGTVQNSTGSVSSTEGGAGAGDAQTLTVTALPTVALTSPADGSTFDFRQKVVARYSCKEAPGGPGLSDCSGDVPSGSPIDTTVAGPQTFSVSAISLDGGVTTQTVNYTVRPDNRFTITHLTGHANGAVSFAIKVPGPGKIALLESAPIANLASSSPALTPGKGRFSYAKLTRQVHRTGTVKLTVEPSPRGARLVKKHHTQVLVRLLVRFTPAGGRGRNATFAGVRIP